MRKARPPHSWSHLPKVPSPYSHRSQTPRNHFQEGDLRGQGFPLWHPPQGLAAGSRGGARSRGRGEVPGSRAWQGWGGGCKALGGEAEGEVGGRGWRPSRGAGGPLAQGWGEQLGRSPRPPSVPLTPWLQSLAAPGPEPLLCLVPPARAGARGHGALGGDSCFE